MANSGEARSETPAESADRLIGLRLNAKRVVGGVNLLRWALITLFASVLLKVLGAILIERVFPWGTDSWAWGRFALDAPGWVAAPLALMGFVRILRVRNWYVPHGLVIVLVLYFAVSCIWVPAMSAYNLIGWLRLGEGAVPSASEAATIFGLLLSLAYFAALFASYHLAGDVDEHLNRCLVSQRHRWWLLQTGIGLHGLKVASSMTLEVLTATGLAGWSEGNTNLDTTLLAVRWLTTGITLLVWNTWLLVVLFRVGRRLKRFVRLNHCPRCDYDLHERVDAGCPECGWGRSEQVHTDGS